MTEYNTDKNQERVERAIKDLTQRFINRSEVLTPKQRDELIKELDVYKYRDSDWSWGEDMDKWFAKKCMGYSLEEWIKQNLELVEFWKQVCVENSKINNTPEITANNALEVFKKQFKLS